MNDKNLSIGPKTWTTLSFAAACFAALAAISMLACGSSAADSANSAQGTAGAECYGNGTCNTSLTCVAGTCVAPGSESSDVDGGAVSDDGATVASDTPATYTDLGNSAAWSSFDTASLGSTVRAFEAGAFDGRYIYVICDGANSDASLGAVARYDTQAPFGTTGSWSTFYLTTLSAAKAQFSAPSFGPAATFDGRYVYFTSSNGPIVARYDTKTPFEGTAGWSTFDVSALGSSNGAGHMLFDGRYVYMLSNPIRRYDTKASFTDAASWQSYDPATVNPNAGNLGSSVFDGRYIYMTGDQVTRYDTKAALDNASAWVTFDVSTTNVNVTYFFGGSFDGRYVYFGAPFTYGTNSVAVAARYDTTADFTSGTSWKTFDIMSLNAQATSFVGTAFDGRYFYMAPADSSFLARYDTQDSFDSLAAWTTLDITTVSSGRPTGGGMIFDGRYMYLPDDYLSYVTRFDAKLPPSMPSIPGWFPWGPASTY